MARSKFNRKKVSEYGGAAMPESTVHPVPHRLRAEERRRLLVRNGNDNASTKPHRSWWNGRRPRDTTS